MRTAFAVVAAFWLLLSAAAAQSQLTRKSKTVLSAATNNSQLIGIAGQCRLHEITALQTASTLMDVRLYDTATAPTCSSATGVVGNYVVASKADSAGFTIPFGDIGKTFSSGLGVCVTGANANDDNTNAVVGLNLNFTYSGRCAQ